MSNRMFGAIFTALVALLIIVGLFMFLVSDWSDFWNGFGFGMTVSGILILLLTILGAVGMMKREKITNGDDATPYEGL